MAATAMNADQLKQQNREAEGKRSQASGQSNAKNVYAYSLAWSPDEQGKITREEMTTAAEDTLERLGFKDHQAMFICHNDTDHPHVHVLVNKVNPETGKSHNPHRDFNKLDKWANDYRKDRGEEDLCPNRAKKWENHDAGKSNKNREKQTNARLEKGQSKTLHDKDPYATKTRKNLADRGNRISEIGKRQKARHAQEWTDHKASNKATRDAIYSKYERPMDEARSKLEQAKFHKAAIYDKFAAIREQRVEMVKANFKPAMSALGKQQRQIRAQWQAWEDNPLGRLSNATTAAFFYRKTEHSRGLLSDIKMMMQAKDQRLAALESIHRVQFDKLSKQMKTEIGAVKKQVNAVRDQELTPHKEAYSAAREEMTTLYNHRKGELAVQKMANKLKFDQLRTSQTNDNQRLRNLWGKLKEQRNEAITRLKRTLDRKAKQQCAHDQSLNARVKN